MSLEDKLILSWEPLLYQVWTRQTFDERLRRPCVFRDSAVVISGL
jgi:hypothetical protein